MGKLFLLDNDFEKVSIRKSRYVSDNDFDFRIVDKRPSDPRNNPPRDAWPRTATSALNNYDVFITINNIGFQMSGSELHNLQECIHTVLNRMVANA
jgi:hypothetical protein